MRKNIHKNWSWRLAVKSLLFVPLSLMLTSCIIQTGGYSETDGVYYDPNTDTLPEGYVTNDGNQVGDYYNYQDQSVIQKSNQNQEMKNSRYDSWYDGSSDSDWGNFAGTETNYDIYPNYGFGNYFGYGGYYSPYGYGYNPYWSFGYNPYWSYYNSFGGFYNPYYGGFYGNYYGGYYGGYYNNYYGNYYNPYNYKRSGENGGGLNNRQSNRQADNNRLSNNKNYIGNRNNGFRGNSNGNIYNNQNTVRTRNNGVSGSNGNSLPRYRDQSTSGTRYQQNQQPIRTRDQYQPRRSETQPTRSQPSYEQRDNGGFRSSSSDGGGMRSSGSSSSGSTRSSGGGFRR